MDMEFEELVRKEFRFLEGEYGFERLNPAPNIVVFTSVDVFISVRFDADRSYEISCGIGRNDNLGESLRTPFDLGEIVRSRGLPEARIHTSFQITNEKTLEQAVKELAFHLKAYAEDLLRGDAESFRRVAEFRDTECDEYAFQRDLMQMRNQLGIAWRDRNFPEVIRLAGPYKKHLEKAEVKKLEYAIRTEKDE